MKFQDFREKIREQLCSLDEAQVLCVQANLKKELRQTELLLNDVQLRLDYLGVFTPLNIYKAAKL